MKSFAVLCAVFTSLNVVHCQSVDSLLNILTETDVNSLKGEVAHREFLENVFQVDQGIRNDVAYIEQNYGRNSAEYDSIFVEWVTTDRFLFRKIVAYLELHPYPAKELGGIACTTPQLVFHHLGGTKEDLEMKVKFLPMFYDAYLSGNLRSSDFWVYLFRLYDEVVGNQFVPVGDGGEDAQIKVMYDEITTH